MPAEPKTEEEMEEEEWAIAYQALNGSDDLNEKALARHMRDYLIFQAHSRSVCTPRR
jgi:hypothetical protein